MRENTNVKGQPNLTAGLFCQWVNENLLPYSNVEPGFLRKVSIKTCHQWLHKTGFEQLSPNKGMYFDGHERERMSLITAKKLLKRMVEIGFLHPDQVPTPEAARAFSKDISLQSN